MNKTKILLRGLLITAGLASASVVHAQTADTDGDGVPNVLDNCVNTSNADQRDVDADGFGSICDADLNNDLLVDALDVGLFRRAQTTQDPNADFNGDGKVDSTDLTLLRAVMGKPPGPSSVKLSSALAVSPPTPTHLDVFGLDRLLPDGSNAAIFHDFRSSVRSKNLASVVSMVYGRAVPFNDLGLEPDQKAGDGVYSGFLKLDLAKAQQSERDYLQRLPPGVVPQVATFSGHDLVDRQQFFVPGAEQAPPIKLPSGVVLTKVPLRTLNLFPIAPTANPAQSLTITDRSVVTDKTRTFDPCDVDGDGSFGAVNGPWSFKTLMTNMNNGTGLTADQFVKNWLLNWMSAQTVNGFTIAPRVNIKNFFPGWNGTSTGTLDMDKLPFRLLAIVNRMDLAGGSFYGQPPNPKKSETRFVFGLVDETSASCKAGGNLGAARRMTVIFEFGDPTQDCTQLQSRASQWLALSSLPFPSPAYNSALQALTDGVTLPNANPAKPNGSALDQLRTNEIALSAPWQLREFGLPLFPASNLTSVTVKQTPDPALFRFGSATTQQFWETNADAILCESHVVPDIFLGNPFLGSHTDYGLGTFWDAPTVIPALPFPSCWKSNVTLGVPTKKGEVRHKFSLNTCDDCHSGETNTFFTHVDPLSSPAALSGFLTGVTVNDPGGEPVQRTFNDLNRRAQALESVAQGCGKASFLAATAMTSHD